MPHPEQHMKLHLWKMTSIPTHGRKYCIKYLCIFSWGVQSFDLLWSVNWQFLFLTPLQINFSSISQNLPATTVQAWVFTLLSTRSSHVQLKQTTAYINELLRAGKQSCPCFLMPEIQGARLPTVMPTKLTRHGQRLLLRGERACPALLSSWPSPVPLSLSAFPVIAPYLQKGKFQFSLEERSI